MTTVTTPTDHSIWGASSYYRWNACPGSIRLSKDAPRIESEYARKGVFAHDKAANCLQHGEVPKPEDFEDEDEYDSVMFYIESAFAAMKGATFYKIEEKFDLSRIKEGCYGTADLIVYHEKEKLLQVWDYKHGKGIPVEVENNGQLKYYGLGALLKTGVQCKEIELVICQPRCPHPEGPIRKWRLDVLDLLDFSADLIDAVNRTLNPEAQLEAGDHCRFCPAAPLCPQLALTAVTNAQQEFSPEFSYDPKKLSETLGLIPAIEAWVKSVKEFAYHEVNQGKEIPGYKLVPKRANRKWKDEEEAEDFLLMEFGLSYTDVKKITLRTPAQIESLLDKDQKKALERLVVKESSGTKLVPMSDKTPPAKPAVETEFTVVNPLLD